MTGLLQLFLLVSTTLASEPSCPACSKYDYEQNLLERMIRMEFTVEQDLTRLKNENKRLSEVVDTLMDQQKHAERRLVSRIEDVERNQTNQIATPLVYFHARSPQTTTLTTGEVILYKTVETNQGNGYSSTSGKFTAPTRGLYLFFMHTCTPSNKFDVLRIVKEGSVLIASVQRDNNNHVCSSSQAFVQLYAGDAVWVKCSSGSSDRQLFEDSIRWTSFGGALIHN
ncbi:caprin-2-like [Mya arenaria]|uniref:caprin-2-like n=1 Tax=Mya arenaria TaxID=6604 RepID=UPI0022E94530|nr:caprin-2-like [Mya arenaria]XP_052765495.1 caprin-2-like [Mya arenaria]XP_052765496.1 caprin-2-like [Mya arenaria]